MANNEIKTNAEIYREQRKERLAKAAKKKKNGKGDKIIRILVKTICILLVAGVVLYGAGNILTKVFCLPQKLLTVGKYEDEKINVAEYNYYYLSLYNQIASTTQQIDSYYGSGYGTYYTGFDLTTDPAEQEYIGEDAPEGVETWADYFRLMAPEKAVIQRTVYALAMSDDAKKEGFEITEDMQKEIDEQIDSTIEELQNSAESNDYSLNNYISKSCGEGLTEKSYRELLNRDLVVEKYLTWYEEYIGETITDDEVKAYYEENKADFDLADARIFAISYAEAEEDEEDSESTDATYTEAEAKKLAEEFKSKVTGESSFAELAIEYAPESQKEAYEEDGATLAENLVKSTIEANAENVANWLFDSARETGDVAVINEETQEAYYVVYVVSPAAPDRQTAGADVRHILVEAATTEEDTEGNEVDLSEEEIEKNFAEAKKEAEAILKEWKAGDATEESFTALAEEKSDDTGVTENSGLYEDITSTSSYVPEFLDWALASHKVGDTDIIKTDYGYHVMYFVGADEMEKWESDVRDAIAEEKFNDFSTELYEKVSENIKKNESIIKFFVESNEKMVDKYVSYYSSSSSSTISY
ncbi:MAG: peptidylprolyl isomerase [Acutalibacteraceae bacterium]